MGDGALSHSTDRAGTAQSQRVSILAESFSICRLPAHAPIPSWAVASPFFSVTRTADELSVVCRSTTVPDGVVHSDGWRALKVAGPIDFASIGVMLSIARPLADAGVSMMPIATYDTDYVLVRVADLTRAINALSEAGHRVGPEPG